MTAHCRRCEVEWGGAPTLNCWMCGGPGSTGEVLQADGQPYRRDSYTPPTPWRTRENTL